MLSSLRAETCRGFLLLSVVAMQGNMMWTKQHSHLQPSLRETLNLRGRAGVEELNQTEPCGNCYPPRTWWFFHCVGERPLVNFLVKSTWDAQLQKNCAPKIWDFIKQAFKQILQTLIYGYLLKSFLPLPLNFFLHLLFSLQILSSCFNFMNGAAIL